MDNQIINALLYVLFIVIAAVIICFLVPWLREKAKGERQDTVNKILDTLVEAAEQIYGAGKGGIKYKHVATLADDKGIKPSSDDIEAAVLRLNAAGMGWGEVYNASSGGGQGETPSFDSLEPFMHTNSLGI